MDILIFVPLNSRIYWQTRQFLPPLPSVNAILSTLYGSIYQAIGKHHFHKQQQQQKGMDFCTCAVIMSHTI
jgi:hypothetical protein